MQRGVYKCKHFLSHFTVIIALLLDIHLLRPVLWEAQKKVLTSSFESHLQVMKALVLSNRPLFITSALLQLKFILTVWKNNVSVAPLQIQDLPKTATLQCISDSATNFQQTHPHLSYAEPVSSEPHVMFELSRAQRNDGRRHKRGRLVWRENTRQTKLQ